jgi:integrase
MRDAQHHARPNTFKSASGLTVPKISNLHEARHTCASIFIAAGVNAKALSIYMGHSSIQVTYERAPDTRQRGRGGQLIDIYPVEI